MKLKYYPLTPKVDELINLESEYKNGREIGIIRLGDNFLFFRKKLKVYFIHYSEITRCFRRVMTVPATLCCGKGNFAIENLVLYAGEEEVAQIQLPGTKAAKILMDELKVRVPNGNFLSPKKMSETMEEDKQ